MFDGVPDQFHQFITPRKSLPLHLPFPLHASATTTTPSNPNTFPTTFDPYNHHPSHHHQFQLPSLLPLHHHHPASTHKEDEGKEENIAPVSMNFEIDQRDQSRQQLPELIDPWTNDEVLALLRIRSGMESWFPDFTWEHVSRKLAEVGYKRSAEKCKEKFEEETRYFNNNMNTTTNYAAKNNSNNNNNYRFVSELEELYHHQGDDNNQKVIIGTELQDNKMMMEEEDSGNDDASVTEKDEQNDDVVEVAEKTNNNKLDRKRKRSDRFEVFKGFCESVVQTMMTQQEEMHNKLLQDMLRRDEEKFNREEAWKKQEMEKMNKELEIMTREQAIAGDRQANIIEFLKKFSSATTASASASPLNSTPIPKVTHCNSNPNNPSAATEIENNNNNNSTTLQPTTENPSSNNIPSNSSTSAPIPKNPSSNNNSLINSQSNNPLRETYNKVSLSMSSERDEIGRRWPKDEVLALINLRCTSLQNSSASSEDQKEGNSNKAVPLWERISQGMLELGYKRSAKRCKEKWENINKYFRKTKDANKKRSLDSRTCPYFHLLSNLYKQGKLLPQISDQRQEEGGGVGDHLNVVVPANPEQQAPPVPDQVGPGGGFTSMQVQVQVQEVHHGGEKTNMMQQVPSLDFDQF